MSECSCLRSCVVFLNHIWFEKLFFISILFYQLLDISGNPIYIAGNPMMNVEKHWFMVYIHLYHMTVNWLAIMLMLGDRSDLI